MKTVISDETLFKLADASVKSSFRTVVAMAVSRHFRSMHYLSSKLICDCVVLNVLLNNEITPDSADEIITCFHRRNKSFYTTVESAFFSIEDTFDEYATTVLADNFDKSLKLNMRTTNYIVYVISKDIKEHCKCDPSEVYHSAYSYAEILEMDEFPHY